MKSTRQTLSASLDTAVKNRFDKFCQERQINKSRLVEWLIEQHIEQFKCTTEQERLNK